jgi:hypothetical protein
VTKESPHKQRIMSIATILLLIVVLVLLGILPVWPGLSRTYGELNNSPRSAANAPHLRPGMSCKGTCD